MVPWHRETCPVKHHWPPPETPIYRWAVIRAIEWSDLAHFYVCSLVRLVNSTVATKDLSGASLTIVGDDDRIRGRPVVTDVSADTDLILTCGNGPDPNTLLPLPEMLPFRPSGSGERIFPQVVNGSPDLGVEFPPPIPPCLDGTKNRSKSLKLP